MKLIYADPPYLGCCKLYDHEHGDGTPDLDAAGQLVHPWDGLCWDDITTHRLLIEWLGDTADGWAYCMTSQSLRHILPATDNVTYRVASWVKPFAAFKRNVRIAYTWEPVLFSPGRDRSVDGAPVGRDHLSESITLRKGFTGAKPDRFNHWILDLMGHVEGDEVVDLFPGTGGMSRALDAPRLAYGSAS